MLNHCMEGWAKGGGACWRGEGGGGGGEGGAIQ